MSKKLYEESNIQDIASAIREKNEKSDRYTTSQMAAAIRDIKTQPVLEDLNASENGIYTPSSGKDGFGRAVVNVQPKLEELNASENGTYTPSSGKDGFSRVNINVPSGGGSAVLVQKTITANGIYNALLDDEADGYSEVQVNVSAGSSYDAYHVWTKSTGGFDAALYIQKGTFANEEFTSEDSAIDLIYTDARSQVEYESFIGVMYNPNWQIHALRDVIYNGNTYSAGDLIEAWNYNQSKDILIVDANTHVLVLHDLTVDHNGQFLPSQYGADGFAEVSVDVQANLETLYVVENGDYTPSSGKDGFDVVHVMLPSGGGYRTPRCDQVSTFDWGNLQLGWGFDGVYPTQSAP